MKKMIPFLALVSFSAVGIVTDNTIKPIVLMALKKDSSQYISICKAAGKDCKPGAAIWKKKSNDNYYLVSPGLQFVEIRKDKNGNGYSKINSWDFSDEVNSGKVPDRIIYDDLMMEKKYIYPALYPLGDKIIAVALVSTWSTSYSGGGREEEYADFMMINDDGSYRPAFENVLFSSKDRVSACFSEDDYARNSHCHDENWSVLHLNITDRGVGKFYSWKFITKSYNWPAFKDKASIQVKTTETVAVPFELEFLEI